MKFPASQEYDRRFDEFLASRLSEAEGIYVELFPCLNGRSLADFSDFAEIARLESADEGGSCITEAQILLCLLAAEALRRECPLTDVIAQVKRERSLDCLLR